MTAKKQLGNNGGITGKGFKPGVSGNPKGRPKKGFTVTEYLRQAGELTAPKPLRDKLLEYYILPKNVKITMSYAVALLAYIEAADSKPWAFSFITGRTEGKPAQTVIQKDSNKPDFSEVEFVRFKQ